MVAHWAVDDRQESLHGLRAGDHVSLCVCAMLAWRGLSWMSWLAVECVKQQLTLWTCVCCLSCHVIERATAVELSQHPFLTS